MIIEEIKARFTKLQPFVTFPIPYFSQCMSHQYVDEFIAGKKKETHDPLWKKSGAKTKEEYALWTRNACGMACLQMILKYIQNKDVPLVTLAKQCETYGGYIKRGNTFDGLFYEPFCRFIKEEFDLTGNVAPFLTTKRIQYELHSNHFVIASVHPSIRNVKSKTPQEKGGHLVLVTGYDINKETISLHNPSGSYKKSQVHYTLPEKEFKRFFAGRGIIVCPNI